MTLMRTDIEEYYKCGTRMPGTLKYIISRLRYNYLHFYIHIFYRSVFYLVTFIIF